MAALYQTRFSLIPEELLDAGISDRAYRLFGLLARYAGSDKRAFPSRKTLSARMKCGPATVDRALAELTEAGFVTKTSNYRPDGGQTSSSYYLTGGPPSSALDPPLLRGEEGGPHRWGPYKGEPDNESQGSKTGADAPVDLEKQRGRGSDYRFDDFWALYPQRNGRKIGKRLTREMWVKMTYKMKAAAFKGLRVYATECDLGATIAKDPNRWLQGRCWEDWLEPGGTPRGKAAVAAAADWWADARARPMSDAEVRGEVKVDEPL